MHVSNRIGAADDSIPLTALSSLLLKGRKLAIHISSSEEKTDRPMSRRGHLRAQGKEQKPREWQIVCAMSLKLIIPIPRYM
jgi:hypothetical protein